MTKLRGASGVGFLPDERAVRPGRAHLPANPLADEMAVQVSAKAQAIVAAQAGIAPSPGPRTATVDSTDTTAAIAATPGPGMRTAVRASLDGGGLASLGTNASEPAQQSAPLFALPSRPAATQTISSTLVVTQAAAIADLLASTDKIDLSAFGFTSFALVQATMIENGRTNAIQLGSGDFVVLNGVANAALHAGDFILTGTSAMSAEASQFGKMSRHDMMDHDWAPRHLHPMLPKQPHLIWTAEAHL